MSAIVLMVELMVELMVADHSMATVYSLTRFNPTSTSRLPSLEVRPLE